MHKAQPENPTAINNEYVENKKILRKKMD